MITSIHIENFKLHTDTTITTAPLTILTGMNGMGKSSIFQALLLLRQSFMLNDLEVGLNLKGDLCDAGVASELACQASDSEELVIALDSDQQNPLEYRFKYPTNVLDTLIPAEKTNPSDKNILSKYSSFNDNFQYISAFRFGPQKNYERDTSLVQSKRQISKKMGKCEYVVHYLDYYRNENIPILELAICDEVAGEVPDYRLAEQVERWMRRIAPNIKLNVESQNEDFLLKFRYNREQNRITEEISALNTGFGIPYMLPILVSVLSARRGSLILIENPEAHIHPSGQAVLMELIGKAAAQGVQIMIETHSDHIINGSLVGIRKGWITSDKLSVYFFDRNENLHVCQPHQLTISTSGGIKNPPKGFFDQIDIDLRTIAGF